MANALPVAMDRRIWIVHSLTCRGNQKPNDDNVNDKVQSSASLHFPKKNRQITLLMIEATALPVHAWSTANADGITANARWTRHSKGRSSTTTACNKIFPGLIICSCKYSCWNPAWNRSVEVKMFPSCTVWFSTIAWDRICSSEAEFWTIHRSSGFMNPLEFLSERIALDSHFEGIRAVHLCCTTGVVLVIHKLSKGTATTWWACWSDEFVWRVRKCHSSNAKFVALLRMKGFAATVAMPSRTAPANTKGFIGLQGTKKTAEESPTRWLGNGS